jgi:hypothetical protein
LDYFELTFEAHGDSTLTFQGWQMSCELQPNGARGGQIGKASGAEVEGAVQMTADGWKLVGERTGDCWYTDGHRRYRKPE